LLPLIFGVLILFVLVLSCVIVLYTPGLFVSLFMNDHTKDEWRRLHSRVLSYECNSFWLIWFVGAGRGGAGELTPHLRVGLVWGRVCATVGRRGGGVHLRADGWDAARAALQKRLAASLGPGPGAAAAGRRPPGLGY